MTAWTSRLAAARTGRTVPVVGVVLSVVVAVVVAAVALVLVGPSSRGQAPQGASDPRAARVDTDTDTDTDTETRAGAETRSVPAPGRAAAPVAAGLRPVRITIPAIGVDAAVTDLGVARDGTIEVPKVPSRAGWLTTSPAPGQRGPAVIAGHVDSTTGPAVFYRLRELRAGDSVVLTRADGRRVRFTVDGIRTYAKNAFPTQATYGPVPGPALRLITCGGSYVKSRGGYLDNVVVFAT